MAKSGSNLLAIDNNSSNAISPKNRSRRRQTINQVVGVSGQVNCKRPINGGLFRIPIHWLNPVHANSMATVLRFLPPFWRQATLAEPNVARHRAHVRWLWPSAAASRLPHWRAPLLRVSLTSLAVLLGIHDYSNSIANNFRC